MYKPYYGKHFCAFVDTNELFLLPTVSISIIQGFWRKWLCISFYWLIFSIDWRSDSPCSKRNKEAIKMEEEERKLDERANKLSTQLLCTKRTGAALSIAEKERAREIGALIKELASYAGHGYGAYKGDSLLRNALLYFAYTAGWADSCAVIGHLGQEQVEKQLEESRRLRRRLELSIRWLDYMRGNDAS